MDTIEKLIRAFEGPSNARLRAEIRRRIAEDPANHPPGWLPPAADRVAALASSVALTATGQAKLDAIVEALRAEPPKCLRGTGCDV